MLSDGALRRSGARRAFPLLVSAVFVLGALALVAAPARAQQRLHPLSTLPLGDPAYVQLDGLARRGCDAARVSPFRPFLVGDIVKAVRAASANARCAPVIVAALAQRFAQDTQPTVVALPPIDTVSVAPDLAAAANMTRAVARVSTTHSYVGGAIGAAVTALGRGEYRPLYAGVRPVTRGTPPGVLNFHLRGVYDGGPHFVAVSEGYLQSSKRNDPLVRGKDFAGTDAVLDFAEAYASGRLGPVVISGGRSRESWTGSGDESLILSAEAPPLDRVLLSGRWGRLEARAMFAALNDVKMDPALDSLSVESGSPLFHRSLIAHALSYRPTAGSEITIGETMLMSRRSRDDGLSYLNVLMPFIVSQNDTGLTYVVGRDNLMLYGTGRAHVGPAVVSGELAVDDFQYGTKDRATVANQIAWRLNASVPVPTSRPAALMAEYRHVNTYTYERAFYTEVYQIYDRSLGSELGPDADLARAGAEVWVSGNVLFGANVGRWRQGALRIDQRPSQSANNGPTDFPSTSAARPVVQQATLADVSLRLLRVTLPITARFEAARVQNPGNVLARTETYVRAQLIASYAFRYP